MHLWFHLLVVGLLASAVARANSAESPVLGPRVIAIDFNMGSTPAALTQGGFRAISGSTNAAENTGFLRKRIGRYWVEVATSGNSNFEFRSAELHNVRAIPGGFSAMPLLLADSIASRVGGMIVRIRGLEPGWYFFRSYHFESSQGPDIGRIPGSVRAHIGGELKASVGIRPMRRDATGHLAIADDEVPVLTVPFRAVADEPSTLVLSSPEGVDAGYVFLNGFEVFAMP